MRKPFVTFLHGLLSICIAMIAAFALGQGAAHAEASFLTAEEAFVLTVDESAGSAEGVALNWAIAPGYYLYRDRIDVTAQPPGVVVQLDRPPGEQKNDPNFGLMEVYHDAVTVQVHPGTARDLTVTWQGCAEAGLCYPPQTRKISLGGGAGNASALPAPISTVAASADASPKTSLLEAAMGNDSAVQQLLTTRSLAWTLPIFFLLGVALAFTPCVLPMVPIVSSIVVGSQAGPRRSFALSLAFVLPMALTYAALGVAAALAGSNLQAWLQNRWTLFAFGGVFVVLALGMFGFFELQLPAFLRNRLDRVSRARQGGTLSGAAGMGALSALLVGPCMTAPLAGALLYIAQSGNVVQGGLLLLFLGLGMGVPLLVVGTLGTRCLPRPGPWMNRIKGVFGFLLLGTAIWMVQRVVAPFVALALWGALCLSVALTLFQMLRTGGAADAGRTGPGLLVRSLALVVGLWGAAMVFGAAAGSADPWRPLAGIASRSGSASQDKDTAPASDSSFQTVRSPQELQARLGEALAAGQPVLVDFYADWCVSCKAIESEVFGNAKVQRALAGVMRLRADITEGSTAQQNLMRKHQILGPPTVMLFDAQGRERRDARLVGEFTVKDLLQRNPEGSGL
ncbi:MAG: protein-disulfide reductase DsbD [Comamonadaceae bacterium]|nr:protein-disulfide reductase DsbD [Comamonadaceae bacterium]